MLDAIGVASIESLFEEIPSDLKLDRLQLNAGLSEQAMLRQFSEHAARDVHRLCFLGAGAYKHHVPAAILDLIGRGEFMTAYTPYQAEASQGALQIIYEYQSMICQLTGMEVANASVYDGATALAEAMLMAVRQQRSRTRILCLGAVHPHYLATAKTIISPQGVEIESVPLSPETGQANLADCADDVAAVVIQQPNFYGVLEQVDAITEMAQASGALVIAVVNPTSLAVLKSPGDWGTQGADIVVGEGQPLGVPTAGGGPYFGFMCTRKSMIRQLPGRIVGRTRDAGGQTGFTLTLQTREQHIRRARATSNICTNQGLLVVAATLYMSLLGAEGLARVARASHRNTLLLKDRLTRIKGVEVVFDSPFFHECLLRLPVSPEPLVCWLAAEGILAGLAVADLTLNLDNGLLVCATEIIEPEDIEVLAERLEEALAC